LKFSYTHRDILSLKKRFVRRLRSKTLFTMKGIKNRKEKIKSISLAELANNAKVKTNKILQKWPG